MLTDAEKKKITEEEIFRKEVQDSLKTEKEGTIWKFLNSSFGIWLLSSVVLGLITFAYTTYEKNETESKQDSKEITALDAEIGGRLKYFNTQINSAASCGDYVGVVGRIIVYPELPQEIYAINNEYADQNFRTLFTKLSALVKDDSDRKEEVKRALEGLDQIQQNARPPMGDCPTKGSLYNPMTPAQTSSLRIIKSALESNFNSDHWQ
jgi:hypothetical protein